MAVVPIDITEDVKAKLYHLKATTHITQNLRPICLVSDTKNQLNLSLFVLPLQLWVSNQTN